MQPQLTILIVNWNSKEWTRKALSSVARTCGARQHQVIVVDNGSFDGTGELVQKEFPWVEFIQLQANVGFGRANNVGAEHARGEWLLLLNPDAEVLPGAVEAMLDVLRSVPDAGLAGPRILNHDGSLQTSCVMSEPRPWRKALDSEFLRRLSPRSPMWGTYEAFQAREPIKVECVSGACMMLSTALFRRVGGFSPEFYMYGEDLDLCRKIREQGLGVYHVPQAVVIHYGGGASTRQFRTFPVVARCVADKTYIQKWQGTRSAVCYRLLMLGSSLARVALLSVGCLLGTSQRRRKATAGLRKWWAIARWAVGLEPWAERLYGPWAGRVAPHGVQPLLEATVRRS